MQLSTVKKITNFVVARSVSGVVVTVAHQNIDVETTLQKVQLYVGAFVLGSMAADAANDHVDKKIDEIADAIKKHKEETTKK